MVAAIVEKPCCAPYTSPRSGCGGGTGDFGAASTQAYRDYERSFAEPGMGSHAAGAGPRSSNHAPAAGSKRDRHHSGFAVREPGAGAGKGSIALLQMYARA